MTFKLTIELVPAPLWNVNPRNLMKRSAWNKIRRQAYADAGQKCALCAAHGRLEAHEIWDYDDIAHVQRLVGFLALCPPCHQVKHLGRTGIMAAQGIIDMEQVIEHFMRVNDCSLDDFFAHREEVSANWRARSEHEQWELDWGPYQHLIDEHGVT